jgi:hypothetical protein
LTLVWALALAPFCARAGGFGSTSALLMAEGLAVRPLGAALAFSALSDDENSLQINPAGLARLDGMALSGGHVLGLLGTHLSYLDLGFSLHEAGAVGLQAAYLGDSDVRRDAQGADLGTFEDRQMLIGLGLAKEMRPGWRFGLQVKGLSEEYAGKGSSSFAGDLGLQGPLPRGWRFGLAVLNAGQQLVSVTGAETFPTPLRIQGGIALPFFTPAWKIEADVQGLPYEQQVRLLVGTELKVDVAATGDKNAKNPQPDTRLSLRGGTQVGLLRNEDPRLYLGAGIELPPNYALDYALLNLGTLGLTHRFSLALHFQDKPNLGPPAGALSAPFGIHVTEQFDGLLITWSDPNERVAGYNLYSDYGVIAERLTSKPVVGRAQKFIKVTKSRTYNFYVRAVGSDGKEGPPSEVAVWVVK